MNQLDLNSSIQKWIILFYFVFICSNLEQLEKRCPVNTSLLFLQSVSGVLAGFTTTLITNPMDTIRARLQVKSNKKENINCILSITKMSRTIVV